MPGFSCNNLDTPRHVPPASGRATPLTEGNNMLPLLHSRHSRVGGNPAGGMVAVPYGRPRVVARLHVPFALISSVGARCCVPAGAAGALNPLERGQRGVLLCCRVGGRQPSSSGGDFAAGEDDCRAQITSWQRVKQAVNPSVTMIDPGQGRGGRIDFHFLQLAVCRKNTIDVYCRFQEHT